MAKISFKFTLFAIWLVRIFMQLWLINENSKGTDISKTSSFYKILFHFLSMTAKIGFLCQSPKPDDDQNTKTRLNSFFQRARNYLWCFFRSTYIYQDAVNIFPSRKWRFSLFWPTRHTTKHLFLLSYRQCVVSCLHLFVS